MSKQVYNLNWHRQVALLLAAVVATASVARDEPAAVGEARPDMTANYLAFLEAVQEEKSRLLADTDHWKTKIPDGELIASHDYELMKRYAPTLDPGAADYDRSEALYWNTHLSRWHKGVETFVSPELRTHVDRLQQAFLEMVTIEGIQTYRSAEDALGSYQATTPPDRFYKALHQERMSTYLLQSAIEFAVAGTNTEIQIGEIETAEELGAASRKIQQLTLELTAEVHRAALSNAEVAGREALVIAANKEADRWLALTQNTVGESERGAEPESVIE